MNLLNILYKVQFHPASWSKYVVFALTIVYSVMCPQIRTVHQKLCCMALIRGGVCEAVPLQIIIPPSSFFVYPEREREKKIASREVASK